MQQNVTQLEILLSTPSDVIQEVRVVDDVIKTFNGSVGKDKRINLLIRHWESDCYPASGGSPQKLLNDQIVAKCDAVIAIFWNRFGTPTINYDSGTEEEIELMLKAGKQVFLYFSTIPSPLNQRDSTQYSKVESFRVKYKTRGIYWTYSSHDEFRKLLLSHLTQCYLSKKPNESLPLSSDSGKSKLQIQSISEDGQLVFQLVFTHTNYLKCPLITKPLGKIPKLIEDIRSIHLPSRKSKTLEKIAFAPAFKKITAGDFDINRRQNIRAFIENHQTGNIDGNFFNVGELQWVVSAQAQFSGGGGEWEGTPKEIEKGRLLIELEKLINLTDSAEQYLSFIDAACHLNVVLINSGKHPDEDISVTIKMPTGNLIPIKEIKAPNGAFLESAANLVGTLIKQDASPDVDSYPDYSPRIAMPVIRGNDNYVVRQWIERHDSEMERYYNYKVYNNVNGQDILKYHQAYLLHNTATHFPATLFFKNAINKIQYEIKSKFCPEVIKGELSLPK